MESKGTYHDLDIGILDLDLKNPRLPSIAKNQREALRGMVKVQGAKFMTLLEDISINGFGPAVPIAVKQKNGRFVLRDGNRRLTSIKALETPTLVDDLLSAGPKSKLSKISKKYLDDPIKTIHCKVYENEGTARFWVEREHRGELSGVGQVRWDGQVAARFDAASGRNRTANVVLDFVMKEGALSPEARDVITKGKFPITNLERLIKTPYVRKSLGIEHHDSGDIQVNYNREKVAHRLSEVVSSLATKEITVSDIKSLDQRKKYIDRLTAASLTDKDELDSPELLGSPKKKPKKTPKPKQPKKRTSCLPADLKLNITEVRVASIYNELKTLDDTKFINATSVLTRSFLEMTCDYYIHEKLDWDHHKFGNSTLVTKLTAIQSQFSSDGHDDALVGWKIVTSSGIVKTQNYQYLHSVVHSAHATPLVADIRAIWDNISKAMEIIWG